MAAASNAIKIVLMGDGGVGKTGMVIRYTTGDFMERYLPTLQDMYTKDVEISGAPRHLEIDDTAGQDAYEDLRREKLGTGDGYLLVFAINDDTSFAKLDRVKNAVQAAQAKDVPIFLVGTKSDLEEERAVSRKEAENKAKQWGSKYYEVSSKTNTGVSKVFEDIARAVLEESSDPTKGSAGGSVFAGGKAPKEQEGPARRRGKGCTIL